MAVPPDKMLDALKAVLGRLDAAIDKLGTRYQDLTGEITDAIEARDRTAIEFYLTATRAFLTDVQKSSRDTKTAEAQLEEIQKDEDFVNRHYDEIEKLVKRLAMPREALSIWLQVMKNLENDAEAALAEGGNLDETSLRDMADLELEVKDAMKDLEKMKGDAGGWVTEAEEAQELRDAKRLATAKSRMHAVAVLGDRDIFGALVTKVDAFAASANDTKLLENTRDSMADGAKDMRAKLARGPALVDAIAASEKTVQALEIVPVNVDKALKALGIDPKHRSKLSKALSCAPNALEKSLGALAKELNLEMTGKEMLTALRKSGAI